MKKQKLLIGAGLAVAISALLMGTGVVQISSLQKYNLASILSLNTHEDNPNKPPDNPHKPVKPIKVSPAPSPICDFPPPRPGCHYENLDKYNCTATLVCDGSTARVSGSPKKVSLFSQIKDLLFGRFN
jgi:hypothetical protein